MRPAKAIIDLAALRHNLREARRRAGGAKVAAIVKADAYGHGAARVLPALAEADMLGVACIEEALDLREAGASHPILLMEGVFESDELRLVRPARLPDRRARAWASSPCWRALASTGR